MFNIQPGQGLGNGPSKLLAFGLGLWGEIEEGLSKIKQYTSKLLKSLLRVG